MEHTGIEWDTTIAFIQEQVGLIAETYTACSTYHSISSLKLTNNINKLKRDLYTELCAYLLSDVPQDATTSMVRRQCVSNAVKEILGLGQNHARERGGISQDAHERILSTLIEHVKAPGFIQRCKHEENIMMDLLRPMLQAVPGAPSSHDGSDPTSLNPRKLATRPR